MRSFGFALLATAYLLGWPGIAAAESYAEVYGQPHGAPGRLAAFTCALPDLSPKVPTPHVGHPGCFTTAVIPSPLFSTLSGTWPRQATR